MGMSEIFAKVVAGVGGTVARIRHKGRVPPQAVGLQPVIPGARPQGALPTLKMPTAKGWEPGHMPTPAPGLKVNAFAMGLKHPRSIEVLPNGDVLTAEARSLPGAAGSLFDVAMNATMKRAAAAGISPNRISILRDANRDGVAEVQQVFMSGLNQPYGIALVGDTLYVGHTDGVLAYPYQTGALSVTAPGRRIATFKPGGHWTRSLILSADQRFLFVGVGSQSNIGESGMAVEEGRAAIWRLDLAAGSQTIFAGGLRNPVGTAWEPVTGMLWTVVNERDGLGDETPPDYLTSVVDGGFYGWPYCYWGRTVDDRVPQDAALVARAIQPDYALGGHTASLGLCWMPAGTLPGFGDGMVIGQHGSWNRSKLSGYRVVHVPFADGRPSGPPRDILTGFLAPDERHSYGRPVGVAIGPDGALLVADDVGDAIWRVTGA